MRCEFARKPCPRCGGWLYLDRDPDGWYVECLNCGYAEDLPKLVVARTEAAASTKVREQAK
ncbi:MAG TPA: Lar family restriction alleviation protein [bacterium]|nr:Lar family restriction alleviation protein [bacterium]